MAGNFLAGDFLAHGVNFGDLMAENFMAGDFLTWILSWWSISGKGHLCVAAVGRVVEITLLFWIIES